MDRVSVLLGMVEMYINREKCQNKMLIYFYSMKLDHLLNGYLFFINDNVVQDNVVDCKIL